MGSKPNEILEKPFFQGAGFTRIGLANSWAGRTTLSSGSTTVTVSTTLINSDTIIYYGTEASSVGAAASSGGGIVVSSIVSGESFAFSRATATANPWDETVMWTLIRTSQV